MIYIYIYIQTHINGEELEGKTEWTYWKYKAKQHKSAGITPFTSLNRSLSLPSYKLALALQ